MSEYFSILILIFVAVGLGIALVLVNLLFAKDSPNEQKNSSYECGFDAIDDARMRFDIRYYVLAILFILFDLEVAFLVPWALVFKNIGILAFAVMVVFLLILIVGFIYVWKKGGIEWE